MTRQDEARARSIARIESLAASSPTAETILNIFKAGLATVPFAGGIASLISDYIPSARFKRLEDFAKKTAEDLNRLADRVDQEYLHTDDFAFMFEKCFRGAAENPQQEKIDAFRAILVNSAIRKDLSEEEKEYFLNMANSLSVLHIRMLNFMSEPRNYLRMEGIGEDRIRGGFSTFFPIAIPGIPVDVIRSAFGDLHRRGLLNTDESIFQTMTSAQGLRLLGDRVSSLGKRFIQFVKLPES
jgi:hypothetical protein